MKEHDACHESDAPQNLTNVRRHLSGRVVDFRGRAPSATQSLGFSSSYSSSTLERCGLLVNEIDKVDYIIYLSSSLLRAL